jgi:hypothetical protein
MLILHDPNSKASRDFVEANPNYPVRVFDASMRTEYPSIAGFPAVVLWDGSIVSRPQSLAAALAQSKPDRPKFHKMASGSELWAHISTYTPGLASLLYTALTASTAFDNTAVMSDIKNMMKGIVAQLEADHALHSTPSSVIINDPTDPEGLPIPDATMADHLDQMLSECWFGFSYADLMNP